jgi:hypothetical protein
MRQLFNEWVAGHARGTLNDEITAALGEVVAAVTHLEKPGKVVVEITVEPAGSGGRTVAVAGKVTAKPPVPAPEMSIFFAGEQGSLHRNDPFQQRIDAETGEIVE